MPEAQDRGQGPARSPVMGPARSNMATLAGRLSRLFKRRRVAPNGAFIGPAAASTDPRGQHEGHGISRSSSGVPMYQFAPYLLMSILCLFDTGNYLELVSPEDMSLDTGVKLCMALCSRPLVEHQGHLFPLSWTSCCPFQKVTR